MQVQTTTKYLYIDTRMAKIKKADNTVDEDVEQLEFSYIVGGSVNWFENALENSLSESTKAKHMTIL